jgi:hypothetical protein
MWLFPLLSILASLIDIFHPQEYLARLLNVHHNFFIVEPANISMDSLRIAIGTVGSVDLPIKALGKKQFIEVHWLSSFSYMNLLVGLCWLLHLAETKSTHVSR